MISAIRLSGVRLIILCIVRKREVQPSLWNGIIMLVFGSFSRYTLCLQLEREEHKLYEHTAKSELANTAIHSGRSATMVSGIKPNSVTNQYFHVTRTSSFRIFALLTTYNKSERRQNLSTPTAIRLFFLHRKLFPAKWKRTYLLQHYFQKTNPLMILFCPYQTKFVKAVCYTKRQRQTPADSCLLPCLTCARSMQNRDVHKHSSNFTST